MGHFWPILGHLGPFMVTFWPSRVILDLDVALGHSRRVFFFFFVANIAFTRFFCRECRDYVLFGVEFWQKFWQKFLEILRILAEILRKKSATGVSGLCVFVCLPYTVLGGCDCGPHSVYVYCLCCTLLWGWSVGVCASAVRWDGLWVCGSMSYTVLGMRGGS